RERRRWWNSRGRLQPPSKQSATRGGGDFEALGAGPQQLDEVGRREERVRGDAAVLERDRREDEAAGLADEDRAAERLGRVQHGEQLERHCVLRARVADGD